MGGEPERVIRPRIREWPLRARERELFDAVEDLPTWRLADNCRRGLLDLVKRCADQIPTSPSRSLVADLEAPRAQRLAAVALGQLTFRATSAQMMLIATGYEREALSQARSSLEALLRLRQSNDDSSGEAARRILANRPTPGLKAVAQRYGDGHTLRLLDHFAHADVLSVRTLGDLPRADQTEGLIELRPQRGRLRPASQLLEVARTASMVAAGVVEAFGDALELSPWVSAQLIHYRDTPLPEPL
jgi:hypothetical protein